jgi:hypothetical protein
VRWRLTLATLAALVGLAGCSDDAEEPAANGSRDEFCAELRAAVEADLTVFDPLQPASPDQTRAAMARLADAAPDTIATEVRLLADAFAAVTEVLDEFDPADPEAVEELEALDLDEEEIAEAQDAVNAYARDECGIDLAAINAASVSTTTSTTAPVSTVPPTTVPATTTPPTTVPPVE